MRIQAYEFETRGKTGSPSASQARSFNLIDQPVMAFQYYVLGPVPIPNLLRTLQIRSLPAVQVLEYPILVFETSILPLLGLSFLYGGVGPLLWGEGAGRGD